MQHRLLPSAADHSSRPSDPANERLPMFPTTDDTKYPSPILKLYTFDTMQLLQLHGPCIDRDQDQDHREEKHDTVLRKYVGPASVQPDHLTQSTHLNTRSGLTNQSLNLRHCGSFWVPNSVRRDSYSSRGGSFPIGIFGA